MRTILPRWLAGFCAWSRRSNRSPRVTKRLPSRSKTRREPQWLPPVWVGSWRKMTCDGFERRAVLAEACPRDARAGAALAAILGEAQIDEPVLREVRDRAPRREGRPGRGPRRAGTPWSGSESVPSAATMRRRPGRSVTSMRPSGRKARPQGFCRSRATVSTTTSTLSVRRRWVSWARAAGCAPTVRAQARARRSSQHRISPSIRCRRARLLRAGRQPSRQFTHALPLEMDVDSASCPEPTASGWSPSRRASPGPSA